ncbi:IucA/IucC family C-terminal-domain containing protein [Alkalihalobacillus sp. CinArs1]|uniref:IucA/IucC family C-terminal-domain containing protein n=1 Tax=Alkalihalobacillus sp. CinArs1 TaxID=2995314 RepID=UPI0022DDAC3C|nr:IucA/IucC family C-terminal-domain containing protein [Alkalihalobacillus sp. CinArs1]
MLAKPQTFSNEEKAILEKLRLHVGVDPSATGQLGEVKDLLDADHLKRFLQKLVDEGHFPSLIVAGSQFVKRYAFMLLVPFLYSFTKWNKPIVAGPEMLKYNVDTSTTPWMMNFVLPNDTMSKSATRSEMRAKLADELINKNLAPLIETIVGSTKLSPTILWENAAIYLFWLYETELQKDAGEEQLARIQEDFHYLLKEFQCTSFTCGVNPFIQYHTEKEETANGKQRFRRTCCLFDQASDDGRCCKTCPKMK